MLYFIFLSCLTSLDSSKPIQKKISVKHEGLSNPINYYIIEIIVAGMKLYTRRSALEKNKNSQARNHIPWLIPCERTVEILRRKRRVCQNLIKYNNNKLNMWALYKCPHMPAQYRWVSYEQKGVDGGSGGRVRGRPRLGWMDGVKVAFGNRGMTVEAARQCAKDRKEWRALVQM